MISFGSSYGLVIRTHFAWKFYDQVDFAWYFGIRYGVREGMVITCSEYRDLMIG